MVPSSLIAHLNNEAVSFLQEGNYRAAVCDLETALDRLRSQIWYEQNFLRSPPESNEQEVVLRVSSVPIAPSHEMEASKNVFEFYRRAFSIVANKTKLASIDPISSMIVVLYNLAIAYHDDAIRRSTHTHYVRALELYEEILHLMHENGIKGHMLLLMAISNNIGHIHDHYNNFLQTRENLFWVRKLAITCREQAKSIPYDDFAFFHQIVLIFNGKDLNIAPAA
jgi:tetratricopeptide (TPR) repeat protein